MTIQGVYTQQLTLTFSSSSFSSRSSSPAPALTADAGTAKTAAIAARVQDIVAQRTDTATLSPEALNRQGDATKKTAGAVSPGSSDTAELTPDATRGDALFEVLDADGDGTLTEEEFVDGARNLLRRAHGHHRSHRHDDERTEGVRHGHSHEGRRLERRLGRLFDLVDANGDGSVGKDELNSALQKTGRGASASEATAAPDASAKPQTVSVSVPTEAQTGTHDKAEARPTANSEAATRDDTNGISKKHVASPSPASSGLVTVSQITIVTVAIQQYTTLSFNGTPEQFETFRAAA